MDHFLQIYIVFVLSLFSLTSQAIACDPNAEEQKLIIYRSLNPGKGHTVWVGPEGTELISWHSFKSGPKSIEIDRSGELEITISDCADISDIQMISDGLKGHTIPRTHPDNWKLLQIEEWPDGPSIEGKTLLIYDLMELLKDHGLAFMSELEKSAFEQGADMVIAHCERGSFPKIKETSGFIFYSEGHDLDSGEDFDCYTKSLTYGKPAINLHWDTESDSNNEVAQPYFSICIRDFSGLPFGGAIGWIENDDVATSHVWLDKLYIDPSIRSTGLGKLVMSKLEDYAKEHGIDTIACETLEVEAPGFYKKIGYEETLKLPRLIKKDNSHGNVYGFNKSLNIIHPKPRAVEHGTGLGPVKFHYFENRNSSDSYTLG